MPDAGNLFAYNRYMYVAGNPLRLTDSSGHVWETVVDAVSVGYGIYDIYQNGLNWENGTSLAVDVVSTAVPFMPAPGACVRWCDDAVQYGDDAAGWVGNKVDEGVDAAKRWWNGNPCANSFSADTLVMTAGGAKPIAALVEGDIVLAYNEATGRIEVHPITDTISHVDPEIVLLTIDGETLETTAEHPFYEMEGAPWLAVGALQGRWTDAIDLQAGDLVWQADGTTGVVQAVEVVARQQRMYNLTVAEAHTFFVGDGEWLVHNAGPCLSSSTTDAISQVISRNPATSGRCSECAGQIYELLTKEGLQAQIGRLNANTPFLVTKNGTRLSDGNRPFHDFVRVGDQVFDALTGPNGMHWDDYKKLFYDGMFDDGTITVTVMD